MSDTTQSGAGKPTRNDRAREAHFELQTGLKKARELVVKTRFLLAGEAGQDNEDPAIDSDAAAQAAAETSETVQNPSGE